MSARGDSKINQLEKIVPSYIVGLYSAAEALVLGLTYFDFIVKLIGLLIVVTMSLVFIIIKEKYRGSFLDKRIVTISIISSVAYVSTSILNIFEFISAQILAGIFIVLWISMVPFLLRIINKSKFVKYIYSKTNGNYVTQSCNPDTLGPNTIEPETPIYFKNEVLTRYKDANRYEHIDGVSIKPKSNSWKLNYLKTVIKDTELPFISATIEELGVLPFHHQEYWAEFDEAPQIVFATKLLKDFEEKSKSNDKSIRDVELEAIFSKMNI